MYDSLRSRAEERVDRKIKFLQIPELIGKAMNNHKIIANPNVDEILLAEAEAYDYISTLI